MQGCDDSQQELFCTVDLETFIPKDHLLRKIDKVVDLDFLYKLPVILDYELLCMSTIIYLRAHIF